MALGPLEVNISQVGYGTLPVADRRLQTFNVHTGLVAVEADSTYDVLNVSGSGMFYSVFHKSEGIAPNYAQLFCNLDNAGTEKDKFHFDIFSVNYHGITTKDFYQVADFIVQVSAWDTTNNVYSVYSRGCKGYFANSLYFYLKNADTANSSNQVGEIWYFLYTSTKNIKLKPSQWWGQNVQELRKLIKQDYKECEAVIMDRYVINPDDPEDQQISAPRLQIIVPDWVDEKKIIERMIKEGIAEDVLS
ncbi:MAG: hypothetical protein DRP34_00625 [Thermodesulfobacteriota bacterium]|nr:MAG: hypothetical protein DRP34_00625 [Thermodesulfobacteriota bacterium]